MSSLAIVKYILERLRKMVQIVIDIAMIVISIVAIVIVVKEWRRKK